jgi:putative ABC transport system permease protein
MNKKLINFIVKKYLRYDNKNPFISITALLAFLGVALGVMVLIISMAIMNGTSKEFKDKLFTMNYPLTIYPKFDNAVNEDLLKELETKFPHLQFSPYISTQVMVQYGDNMSGGLLFGIDPIKEAKINKVYNESFLKVQNQTSKKYHLITGLGIAEDLGATYQENLKLTLYFTNTSPNGFSMTPKLKRFTHIGNFQSGLTAYDKAYMYTSIDALQTILSKDKTVYDGIHIYSDEPMKEIEALKEFLPSFSVGVVGWWQQNGNFFSAMELEKKALFIVLMLIIIVASLNIISSLLMTVMSRRKEIALLLSLGASNKEIKSIFLKLGLIIGVSGMVFGTFLGFSGMFILEHFDIISIPADVYGTNKLPLELDMVDFISIIIGTFFIVLLSSFYPAHKATKIDILDVLRNE